MDRMDVFKFSREITAKYQVPNLGTCGKRNTPFSRYFSVSKIKPCAICEDLHRITNQYHEFMEEVLDEIEFEK